MEKSCKNIIHSAWFNVVYTPGKRTEWQWKNQPSEGVSPFQNGDFPASHVVNPQWAVESWKGTNAGQIRLGSSNDLAYHKAKPNIYQHSRGTDGSLDPSLKQTAKVPWKMDGWKTIRFLFGARTDLAGASFAVSFREDTNIRLPWLSTSRIDP